MTHTIVPPKSYYLVFAVLVVLLVVTVAAARPNLGVLNVAIALAIAGAKAVLIALYFMHIRYQRPLVALAAIGGILWFLLLIGLTLGEAVSRRWS